MLTLAEGLVGSEDFLDTFDDAAVDLEELLVDLDEEDGEEDELSEFLEELIKVFLLRDDTSERCRSRPALEDEVEL